MRTSLARPAVLVLLAASIAPSAEARQPSEGVPLPRVVFETSMGPITLELDSVNAPATTRNFLALVRAGYYDDMIFHRVIRRKLIQVGVLNADGNLVGLDHPPVPNEADNRRHHGRGTVAMARGSDPQSATTEFFINLSDNWEFNFKSYQPDEYGYTVFGDVVEGLRVAEEISKLDTRRLGPFRNVPKEMVLVHRARVVEP